MLKRGFLLFFMRVLFAENIFVILGFVNFILVSFV